jgi:hypothetical protein
MGTAQNFYSMGFQADQSAQNRAFQEQQAAADRDFQREQLNKQLANRGGGGAGDGLTYEQKLRLQQQISQENMAFQAGLGGGGGPSGPSSGALVAGGVGQGVAAGVAGKNG